MELSVFLAKLLGIYMLIMAGELLFRSKELEASMKDFCRSKGLLVLSGSLSLLFGLGITIGHQVYTFDWRGLITLIGYLLIIRGIARISFPSYLQKLIVSVVRKGYWTIFLIILILGVYLTYKGFNAIM